MNEITNSGDIVNLIECLQRAIEHFKKCIPTKLIKIRSHWRSIAVELKVANITFVCVPRSLMQYLAGCKWFGCYGPWMTNQYIATRINNLDLVIWSTFYFYISKPRPFNTVKYPYYNRNFFAIRHHYSPCHTPGCSSELARYPPLRVTL